MFLQKRVERGWHIGRSQEAGVSRIDKRGKGGRPINIRQQRLVVHRMPIARPLALALLQQPEVQLRPGRCRWPRYVRRPGPAGDRPPGRCRPPPP